MLNDPDSKFVFVTFARWCKCSFQSRGRKTNVQFISSKAKPRISLIPFFWNSYTEVILSYSYYWLIFYFIVDIYFHALHLF